MVWKRLEAGTGIGDEDDAGFERNLPPINSQNTMSRRNKMERGFFHLAHVEARLWPHTADHEGFEVNGKVLNQHIEKHVRQPQVNWHDDAPI
jgi:hypothetical protein